MTPVPPKTFNTAGPRVPSKHYRPPTSPLLPDITRLVAGGHYFVLQAPGRSGKTTALLEAVDQLNEAGACHALYCSLETVRAVPDPDEAMRRVVDAIIVGSFQVRRPETIGP